MTAGRGRIARPRPPDEPAGDADPVAVARSIVLRKLAARARTRAELQAELHRRQVPDDAAAEVLDRMAAVGLIDDRDFARQWVESRQQRRHLSRRVLRQELETKGVSSAEVDAALAPVSTDDELEAARALARKKLAGMRDLDAHVRYRRLAGALARRGFAAGTVATVLRDLRAEPDPGS